MTYSSLSKQKRVTLLFKSIPALKNDGLSKRPPRAPQKIQLDKAPRRVKKLKLYVNAGSCPSSHRAASSEGHKSNEDLVL